jgi:hypothetical protein
MKRDGDIPKVASYYEDVVAPADASRLMIMVLGCQGPYDNLQHNGCALSPRLMNFSNTFILHFKDRVSKKDHSFHRLFTNFKKDGGLKFLPMKVNGKTQNQRWVCDNEEAYKDDLA